ncbi:MAG: hypothetical protein ACOYCE_05650 [Limnochordia bacterium]
MKMVLHLGYILIVFILLHLMNTDWRDWARSPTPAKVGWPATRP